MLCNTQLLYQYTLHFYVSHTVFLRYAGKYRVSHINDPKVNESFEQAIDDKDIWFLVDSRVKRQFFCDTKSAMIRSLVFM